MKFRLAVAVRIGVTALVVAGALPCIVDAQSPDARTVIGVWRGTSTCLVRPSACNDEIVVYRITPTHAPDSLTVDARKIVRGQEEDMGVLACHAAPAAQLTCTMRNGVWYFAVRGDSLTGELRLPDRTRFREVRARRLSSRADAAAGAIPGDSSR